MQSEKVDVLSFVLVLFSCVIDFQVDKVFFFFIAFLFTGVLLVKTPKLVLFLFYFSLTDQDGEKDFSGEVLAGRRSQKS